RRRARLIAFFAHSTKHLPPARLFGLRSTAARPARSVAAYRAIARSAVRLPRGEHPTPRRFAQRRDIHRPAKEGAPLGVSMWKALRAPIFTQRSGAHKLKSLSTQSARALSNGRTFPRQILLPRVLATSPQRAALPGEIRFPKGRSSFLCRDGSHQRRLFYFA